MRVEEQHQPEHDDRTPAARGRRPRACRSAARGAPPKPRMLLSTTSAMNASASPSASPLSPSGLPEDAQVLRRRVRRDGDQDDVVEQDRPAGDEADELVERVAREHRRAAALLVQRRPLDVGHRGQREQQRREQEHERREPERVAGDHAEREVDRARQRRVDDREQERRADAAPQRSRASAPRARRPRARSVAPRAARAVCAARPTARRRRPPLRRGAHAPRPSLPPGTAAPRPRRRTARRAAAAPRSRCRARHGLHDQRHADRGHQQARARTCPRGGPVGRSSHAELRPLHWRVRRRARGPRRSAGRRARRLR